MMDGERGRENRRNAQQRLSAAQDGWLLAFERRGHNFLDPEVLIARKELEEARRGYLQAIHDQNAVRAEL